MGFLFIMYFQIIIGPDTQDIQEIDYSMTQSNEIKDKFHQSISTYLNGIEKEDLVADYCGIVNSDF